MQHSFSVDEIQKVRTQLKSSKSYPNDFLIKQQKHSEEVPAEDCDNSSSGVSSDQEVPVGPPTAFDDRINDHSSMTLPSPKNQQNHRVQVGALSRNAVSLAQLPPPIENEADEKEDIFVPPPPEFEGAASAAQAAETVVLAPPPQFSDNRQVPKVRIVGAVPKTNQTGKQGRLHSQ